VVAMAQAAGPGMTRSLDSGDRKEFLAGVLRLCAVGAWALSISFATINPSIDSAGDTVRTIVLFYLMLCPCGAVWSVDAWLRKRPRPVLVHPWPLRLLFVQMVLIYFCNGAHKVVGRDWASGQSLYYVLGDWTLTRWSYAQRWATPSATPPPPSTARGPRRSAR